MEDRILDRVRKLFALSENNSSEEQAQAAILKAQELLFRYGYTMADLDSKTSSDVIEQGVRTLGKQVPAYKELLVGIIAQNFRVYPIYRFRDGKKTLILIGLEDDVAVCLEVCYFSFIEFENLQKKFVEAYIKEHSYIKSYGNFRSIKNGIKNDYMAGFVQGLRTKFKAQVEEQSLMVFNPKAVQQYVDALALRKGSPRKYSSAGSNQAYGAGYKDGNSLDFSKGKNKLEDCFD